jgi:hypothetical protein
MRIMDLVKAIWDMLNGKKLNTGTITTLIATVLYMAFQQFGLDNDTAVMWATLLVGAVGAIIGIVGYIHRMIKAAQVKKAAPAKQ